MCGKKSGRKWTKTPHLRVAQRKRRPIPGVAYLFDATPYADSLCAVMGNHQQVVVGFAVRTIQEATPLYIARRLNGAWKATRARYLGCFVASMLA